jgi:hypothetical protein
MTVFPHGNAPRTVVRPVGDPSPVACEEVAETLRETFETSVPSQDSIEDPRETDSNATGARRLLERIREDAPAADLAIEVTDSRVRRSPDEGALFGVALEFDTVGVVSTARLVEATEPTDLERLAKEARSVACSVPVLRPLEDGRAALDGWLEPGAPTSTT